MLKINVGAGNKRPDGWFNIDCYQHENVPPLDLQCDVLHIPLPNEMADELMAIHVFEHIYPHDAMTALQEWRRLLIPGGKLILEMPDIVKCARNLLKGQPDHLSLLGMFGENKNGRHEDDHKWGWTFRTLCPLVKSAGFKDVIEKTTVFHKKGRNVRDFRLEAIRA